MADREDVLRVEILRSNHALRQWAGSLRERSRRARSACDARRGVAIGIHDDLPQVPQLDVPAPPDPDVPALGEVRLSELFTIMVDQHGFPVLRSVRALAAAMVVAGYPADHDRVAAADAFDVLEWAIGHA